MQVNGEAPASASSELESADYDPVAHLNTIFSHPSTLSTGPAISQALQAHCHDLDHSISNLVTTQASSDASSLHRIREAQADLAELFSKIDSLRARAVETEQAITEMTADIKRLDGTKRSLTQSMTMLKRLQMLTTAYEQLRSLGRSRQYRECAQLLQAVIQLMAHFKSYRSIGQIATLGKKVAELQRELLEQVCEDFETAFSRAQIPQKRGMLAESCLVIDALGDNAKARLIAWYCNTTLREYRQIFCGNDEAGSLDNISRRYAWLNRVLKTYDHEHAAIFPLHWRVNEMLANAFCQSTREDFKGILQQSARRQDGQTLDVNLLLSCLQETLDFEHGLENRFARDSRPSIDTVSSAEERPSAFEQAISEAFEPYLSLWVDAQDRQLSSMIPRYRQRPIRNADEEFNPQLVIPSSTELFQFYRLDLAQCAKLSTGSRLLELSQMFGKYLDQYSQQVLFNYLTASSTLQTTSVQSQGPSIENIIIILNTADYCYVTCNQLEEKIRARIDEEHKGSVDLQSQADAFMGIAGAAVRALVRKVELDCDPAWREMRNTAWSRLDNVLDQSSYVNELTRRVRVQTAHIRALLQHKQQYARAFCDSVVDAITNDFIINVGQCRPIPEVGAEQMLLDAYALRKSFFDLPNLDKEGQVIAGATPQAVYTKRVTQTTSKIDPLLKTLQVRPNPPEALVQAYLVHMADRSEPNFRTILELKGITRRQEQAQLIELFNAHREGPQHGSSGDKLAASAPIFSMLASSQQSQATSSSTVSQGAVTGGSIPSTAGPFGSPNLGTGKFDPASFGSALLNAARDSVERFNVPIMPSSGPGSRVTSPPPASGGRRGSVFPSPAPQSRTPEVGVGRRGSAPRDEAEASLALGISEDSGTAASGANSTAGGTGSGAKVFGGGSGMAALKDAAGFAVPNVGVGGAAVGSGASTSGEGANTKKNLNDNLRNIGRFFRRDMGGSGMAGRPGSSGG